MHVLGSKRFPLAPILAFLALSPLGAQGQLRTVVSNEIAVSEREATLRLDFQDGGELNISFQEEQVLVDGDVIGRYNRRDGLDLAWRSLLGEVITLDDGPLALALNDWDPPENLSGERQTIASRLDEILEEALSLPTGMEDAAPQEGASVSIGVEGGLLSALLSRTGALSGLAEALEGVQVSNFILKIAEDVVVEPGEVLDGSLILVDGDLDVYGQISGDVIVADGTVRIHEEGVISGDLRVADGRVVESGGRIEGSFLDLATTPEIDLEVVEIEEMRRDLEAQREALRAARENHRVRVPNLLAGVIGNLGNAIAGLLENLVTFLILAVLGVMAVHFQRERLEVIATTARRAPVRSAVVGLAGGFFILPIWIVGIIALAITIIGIPVLLAWVPLFPIAAALAILLGFLAVARNVGEWVADQEYRGLEWIRGSNTFYTLIAGVGALLVPSIAENVSRILGFGFLTGLLGFVSHMVIFAAAATGLGAVLLTRGGKIRPLESYYDFEEEYWADVEEKEPETTPKGTSDGPGEEPEGPEDTEPNQTPDSAEERETEEGGDPESPREENA